MNIKHVLLAHMYHFGVYAVICAVLLIAAWIQPGQRIRSREILYALLTGWILIPALFVATLAKAARLK